MTMFLHSGASLHGHEYSSPPPPNRPPLRIPLLRSALRQMSDNETNATYNTPRRSFQPPVPNSQTQSSSASSRPVSFVETPGTPTPEPRPFRPRPKSESFAKKEHVVRFAEPEIDAGESEVLQRLRSPSSTWTTQSEEDSAYSELSDANTTSPLPRKKRRRTPRSAMRYIVAQPPAHKHRRFMHTRPKLLLQLQQLTDIRPKPAFDVLSSSILRGSLLGSSSIMKRFLRPLGRGAHLSSDDLIIAESEDYDSMGSDDDNDPLSNRELLAVISPRITAGDGGTDIVLADGSIWTAHPMPNASFEFVHINEEGKTVTARWVKRKVAFEDEDNYKFTFSIIDPSTRRHPIMGTLTQSTLEVLNHYTTVSPHSSGRHPPTRPFPFDTNGASSVPHETRTSERTILPVDHRTRMFITVSAMWISLQLLGIISTNSKLCPSTTPPPPLNLSAQGSVRSRRVSGAASIMNTPIQGNCAYQPSTVPPSPAVSVSTATTQSQQPMPTNDLKRASSTGAAFMRRRMAAPPEKRKSINGDSFIDGYAEPPVKLKLYSRIKKALGFKRAETVR